MPFDVPVDTMNRAPWLSVLLPVFNGAKTLKATLASVAPQADGVEVIAVDQGSSDDSRMILADYQSRMNISILDAPDNRNWVQNTNFALAKAKAPHATLLHQDDIWFPGRAKLLKTMLRQSPDARLWVHSAKYINAQGRTVGRFAPPFGTRARTFSSQDALAHLMVQNTFALPAVMFATKRATEVGGLDTSLWYTADWDFWLKLCATGPVAWSPQDCAGFRIHAGAQTLTGSRDLEGFKQQLAEPLNRHMGSISKSRRPGVEKLALASNALNHWLAASYHEQRPPIGPLLLQLLKLGPLKWWPFLRDTRIIQRLTPRVRQRLTLSK